MHNALYCISIQEGREKNIPTVMVFRTGARATHLVPQDPDEPQIHVGEHRIAMPTWNLIQWNLINNINLIIILFLSPHIAKIRHCTPSGFNKDCIILKETKNELIF
ncbi:hypothetical protein AVEN_191811-1 [Araneus ventricosus]|uniref:Uncharacterized protein n=1 Tax=Araneus ventricosus TaxID=182803 RepID=A0A4Y2PYU6_ARAVE|nr:hypothetical protein AVEN_191811-1 [Araneus ventricosus]